MNRQHLYQDFVISPRPAPEPAPVVTESDFERRLARARGKARAEGFADGAKSAETAFDRDMLSRIAEVSEALNRLVNDRSAEDLRMIATLRRLLEAALTAFTAPLAQALLPVEIAEAVERCLLAEPDGELVVEVAPDRIEDIRMQLAPRNQRILFRADSTLRPGTARIGWRGGFDQIDPTNALTAGAALLDERLRAGAAGAVQKKETRNE